MLHRNIFSLAWPAVSEHLLYTVTMMADMIMVSRLGTDSIAAVGVSNTIAFIFISVFGFALRISTQALTARFAGSGSREKIKVAGGNSLLMGIIVGTVISVLGILGNKFLLHVMDTSEAVTIIGATYLRIILGIAFFRFLFFICSGILRGMGDTRTPLFIMIFANIFNVLFNYLLIFGIGVFPELGVLGAGIATGGSYIIAGILIFFITLYLRSQIPVSTRDIKKVDPSMIKSIWRIATPALVENGVRRAGLFVYLKMVTALGTIALAAHQLTIRIEAFSFMMGVGFGVAASTLVGQSLGAEKKELAGESIKKTSYYGLFIMTLMGFFFVLKPDLIFSIFNPERSLKLYSMIALILCAFEQIPLGLFMIVGGGLKGAGDTKTPMLISIVGSIIVRLPLAYLLAFKMNMGFPGVWMAAVTDWWVKAILAVIAYHKGSWRDITFD